MTSGAYTRKNNLPLNLIASLRALPLAFYYCDCGVAGTASSCCGAVSLFNRRHFNLPKAQPLFYATIMPDYGDLWILLMDRQ